MNHFTERALIANCVDSPDCHTLAMTASIDAAAFTGTEAATIWPLLSEITETCPDERQLRLLSMLDDKPELQQWYFDSSRQITSTAGIEGWIREICTRYRRRLARKAMKTADMALAEGRDDEEVEQQLERERARIAEIGLLGSGGQQGMADTVLRAIDGQIRRLSGESVDNDRAIMTVPWCIDRLNPLFGKIRATDNVVLAAYTNVGKSSFARQQALHAVHHQKAACLYVTVEMSESEVITAMAATAMGVTSKIEDSTQQQLGELRRGVEYVRGLLGSRLFIERTSSFAKVMAAYQRFARNQMADGGGIVIIDYLQLLGSGLPGKVDRREHLSHMVHTCKQMALDNSCPIMLISQINREGAQRENGPELYDLRECGDIENDADKVVILWIRKGEENDWPREVQIKCAKNRSGEKGTDILTFAGRSTRFS